MTLPAAYVAEHVQLGYAATKHAAQGLNVDAGHNLTTVDIYVPMTRGRQRNTSHVALTPATATEAAEGAPTVDTPTGGHVKAVDDTHRASARAVLEAGLSTDLRNTAATVEAELDAERLSSMTLLAGRHEAVVRMVCRERLDRHLDDLTATGTLDETTRARLGADQGTEHLSRVLRAVEQAGDDPRQVLTTAVTAQELDSAKSVAQVLSHRITGGQPLPHPATSAGTPAAVADTTADDATTTDTEPAGAGTDTAAGEAGPQLPAGVPADIAPHAAAHLARLTARLEERRTVLGDRAATNPPAWAVTALGPVPTDNTARADWVHKAGVVAGHREATNWEHPDQAIGTMPGLAATERRASHVAAWHALGQPEAGLDATAMTEGRLRIRVRAAELEKAWAPPHADDALRAAEIGAETERQAAALAYAAAENATRQGDHDTASTHLAAAAGHDADHALRTAALEPLTITVTARSAWAAATAVTLDEGTRAAAELTRRGLTPGTEPDRTTTADWLHTHHPDATDDPTRDTTRDVADDDAAERAANRARAITAAQQAASDHGTADINDQAEEHNQVEDYDPVEDHAEPDDQPAEGHDPAALPDPRSPELVAEPAEHGWGHSRGAEAAYDVVPVDATLDDLHAAAAIAAVSLQRLACRDTQDLADTAAHDDHVADQRASAARPVIDDHDELR